MSDWDEDEERAAEGRGVRERLLSNLQVMGFIGRRWMRAPRRFALICGFLFVATLCDLSIPWATGALVDAVSHAGHRAAEIGRAWRAWAALSGLYLCFYALRTVTFRVMNDFSARNMEAVVNDAFERVQTFSADWHADTFSGATVRRITRAMTSFDDVTDALILMLGPTLVVLSGLALSMTVRSPWAGLFCVALVGVFIAYNLITASRFIRSANIASNALDSRIGATLSDSLGGNAVVKSFGAEGREQAGLERVTADWRTAVVKTWNRFNLVGVGQNALLLTLQSGLTGIMLWNWTRGRATPGDVAFAVSAFMLMSGYMRNFGEITRTLQRGLDGVLDVAEFMRTPPQVADPADARRFVPSPGERRGEIALDHVTFRYRNQPEPLYRDFSLRIAAGERVALVGPTGAGKSTFVKLIQRLYDLEGGRILIDGTDIASVTQQSLRQAIAVVPQDPALFHRTIAENIAYARPAATREEIAAAARRARAHDFIARLPNGYDTLVGERGVKLSGGERQRVAIARAFLADAPILILDEATSSLDVETERLVQAATEALMAGRTTIVIAHRLSTIRGADRILVFQDGRVVEEGRHGELVARGGTYARLTATAGA